MVHRLKGDQMPTLKPRVQVTLERETMEAIERFAAASGQSLSRVCSMILDVQTPALFKLAAVMEASKSLTTRARVDLEASLSNSAVQSQSAADEMLAMVSDLLQETEEAPRSSAAPHGGEAGGRARGVMARP